MPDPLKFPIEVPADLKGAQEAKTAIQEVGQAAKEVTQAGDSAAKEQEASDTKQIGTKHRLKEAIKGIALEFPELAHLAHLALNPISLTLGIIVAAVARVRDGFKQLDEVLQTPSFERLTEAVEANKQALRDAAVEAAGFEREMSRMASAQQRVTEAAEAEIDAIHRQARAKTELNDANEALALAQVDAAEKEGKIGGVEAIQKRLATQKQYAEQRRAIAEQEREATIARNERELHDLPTKYELELNLIKANDAAKKAGSEAALQAKLAADKKNVESTEATLEKLKERLDKEEEVTHLSHLDIDTIRYEATKAQIEQQEEILGKAKALYEQDKARSVEKLNAIKAAQEEVQLAEAALKAAKAKTEELEKQLRLLRDANTDAKTLADQLLPIQEKTRQTPAGPQITEARRAARETATGIVQTAKEQTPEGLSVLDTAARNLVKDQQGKVINKDLIDAVVSAITHVRDEGNRENRQLADYFNQRIAEIKASSASQRTLDH